MTQCEEEGGVIEIDGDVTSSSEAKQTHLTVSHSLVSTENLPSRLRLLFHRLETLFLGKHTSLP
jgi:hypothetical protein